MNSSFCPFFQIKLWSNNVNLAEQDHGFTTNGYTEDYLDVLLQQDNFALIDDTLGVIFYPEYRDCRVIRIPQTYLLSPIAFGMPQGSPYKEIIEYQLTKLKEKGVYERAMSRLVAVAGMQYPIVLLHVRGESVINQFVL